MNRGFLNALAASAVVLALAACAGSSEPPLPTADDLARASYERIVSGANVFLMGDHLGYRGTDSAIERVGVRCLDDACTAAFERTFRSSEASVTPAELDLLGERRGVSLVVEELSTDNVDVHVYGGWLEHSLFATESVFLKSDLFPDRGATVVLSYSIGYSSGENPSAAEGLARWEGLMLGRDMSATASRGQVVRGDAGVTVEFEAGAVTADVEFTDIANLETGDSWNDVVWRGLAVENGGFARRNGADDTISGRFYGAGKEEVGGIFERDGIAGAFGGRRTDD